MITIDLVKKMAKVITTIVKAQELLTLLQKTKKSMKIFLQRMVLQEEKFQMMKLLTGVS